MIVKHYTRGYNYVNGKLQARIMKDMWQELRQAHPAYTVTIIDEDLMPSSWNDRPLRGEHGIRFGAILGSGSNKESVLAPVNPTVQSLGLKMDKGF